MRTRGKRRGTRVERRGREMGRGREVRKEREGGGKEEDYRNAWREKQETYS